MDDARGPIVVSLGAITHPGTRHRRNEDAFAFGELGGALTLAPDEGTLASVRAARIALAAGIVLGVYDGAGGYATGDRASRDAARVVHASLDEAPLPPTEDALRDRLARAVARANHTIFTAGRDDPKRRGGCTTATVAALVDACAVIAHAGDSRASVLRGRRLVQLTRDDRLADFLRESGQLTDEERAAVPHGVLTKTLGVREDVEPAFTRVVLRRGDALLLATDGLHDIVGAQTIRAILLRHREPGVACRVLCEEALRAASNRDDLTAVVARFDGEGLRPPIRAESLT